MRRHATLALVAVIAFAGAACSEERVTDDTQDTQATDVGSTTPGDTTDATATTAPVECEGATVVECISPDTTFFDLYPEAATAASGEPIASECAMRAGYFCCANTCVGSDAAAAAADRPATKRRRPRRAAANTESDKMPPRMVGGRTASVCKR